MYLRQSFGWWLSSEHATDESTNRLTELIIKTVCHLEGVLARLPGHRCHQRQCVERVLHAIENRVTFGVHPKCSFTRGKEHIKLKLGVNGSWYDTDGALVRVVLHELTHTICTSVGHTEEFGEKFACLEPDYDLPLPPGYVCRQES